jgi:uncharacterized membrane protein
MAIRDDSVQQSVNDAEWRNPDNWGGPKWMSLVYFSKRDTRRFVPHRKFPSMGWTPNLAHHAGVYYLASVLVGIPLLIIIITTFIILQLEAPH